MRMRFRNQTEQDNIDEIVLRMMEELRKSKDLFKSQNSTSHFTHNYVNKPLTHPSQLSSLSNNKLEPDPFSSFPQTTFNFSGLFDNKFNDIYQSMPTPTRYDSTYHDRDYGRYSYTSHKILILAVILLFVCLFNIIKAFVESRRKAPPARSILIIGPIPEFNRSSAPTSHPNYRPLSSTNDECRINCNPLYDNGRDPADASLVNNQQGEGNGEGPGPGQTQGQGNPLSTASSSSSSDSLNQQVMDAVIGAFIEAIMEECQGHNNPVYDDGTGRESTNYTDRPPSYSELDTVIDIPDAEAPPPSYHEVANNSGAKSDPQEPNNTNV